MGFASSNAVYCTDFSRTVKPAYRPSAHEAYLLIVLSELWGSFFYVPSRKRQGGKLNTHSIDKKTLGLSNNRIFHTILMESAYSFLHYTANRCILSVRSAGDGKLPIRLTPNGEVSERLIELVSKTSVRVSVPRVRIPPSPFFTLKPRFYNRKRVFLLPNKTEFFYRNFSINKNMQTKGGGEYRTSVLALLDGIAFLCQPIVPEVQSLTGCG